MKKHLSMLMLVVALLLPWASKAQDLTDYTFSTGTDSTKWVEMTGATQILTPSNSDGMASSVLNIGFAFPFGEDGFTQYSVNTDGNLRLGPTVTGTANYTTPFSTANANVNNPKINAFGCDGYGVANSHYVKALNVTDDNGDNMLVVEYCMGTYNSNTRNNLYKWQVHLFANGDIEIVYAGDPVTAPAVAHQCGLCVDATEGWIIEAATNTATVFSNGTSTTNAANTWFDAYRYYRFERPVVSCPKPIALTVSQLSYDAATLSWSYTSGVANSFTVYIDTIPNIDLTTANYEITSDTSVTFSNLQAYTKYYYVVVADCGGGDVSMPSKLGTFTTQRYCGENSTNLVEIMSQGTSSATTYTFYNSTSYPIGHSANIFTAEEMIELGMEAPGTIHAISLHAGATACSTPLRIYMGSTALNEFGSSASDSTGLSAMTLVFDGTIQTTIQEWVTIPLTTPYYYSLDSNLVIYFYRPGVPTASGTFYYTTTTPAYRSFYGYRSSTSTSNPSYNRTYLRTDVAFDICYEVPTCFRPSNITLDYVDPNNMSLSWTGCDNADSYLVTYGFGGNETTVVASSNSISLDNLVPGTTYEIAIRSVCGTDTTFAETFTATTQCAELNVLPYTMTFEGANVGTNTSPIFVNCLTRLNNGTQYFGYPYVGNSSGYNHTPDGSNGLYWYLNTTTGTYGDYQYVVMPAVDTGMFEMNTLQFKFWARATSTSYHPVFQVGVMTDPDSINTFQLVENVYVEGTTYAEYTVLLGNFSGHGNYIALRALRPTSAWYATVDDITIELMPTCPPIVDLDVAATTSSAMLTWDYQNGYGEPAGFVVTYDSVGGANPVTLNLTEPTAILSGLAVATNYKAYVSADCGDEYGAMDSIEFSTAQFECAELDPDQSSTVIFSNSTSGQSGCMAYSSWGNTAYQAIWTAAELSAAGLSAGSIIGIDLGFTGCTTFNKELTIFMGSTNVSSISDANMEDPNQQTQVYGPALHPMNTSGWQHYDFSTPFSWDGVSNIIITTFMNQSGGSQTNSTGLTGYYVSAANKARYRYKDSNPFTLADYNSGTAGSTYSYRAAIHFYTGECLTLATCASPIAMLDDVTATTADITWLPGHDETSWDILYRVQGTDTWTTAATGVTTTTYQLTNLVPGTDYEIKVQFECGDNDNTIYSSTVRTRTPCQAMQVPYTYGFEDLSTGTSSTHPDIPCWHHLNNGTSYPGYPYIYASAAHTGTKGLYWYGSTTSGTYGDYQVLVLPEMDTTPDVLQVSFWAKATSTSYAPVFLVGVMDEPDDITTFVPVDTVIVAHATTDWGYYEVQLGSYTGSGRYIAMRANRPSSSWYAYTDDYMVDYIPSCPHVTDLVVDSVSESSVSLSWTAGGSETEWSVTVDGNRYTTFTPSITISNLEVNTGYTFEVRGLCAADDSSMAWPIETRTACAQYLSLPYSEDFDGLTASTTAATGVEVPCWGRLMTGTATYQTGTYLPQLYYYNNTSTAIYTHSGLYSLRLYGVGYHSLPQLPVDADMVTMGFWAKTTSTSYKLMVGVMTDPTDATTFDTVQTLNYTTSTTAAAFQYFEIDFSSYTGTGRYIAFRNVNTSATTYSSYHYIDDIEVWQNSTCPSPVINVANVDHNSVSLTIYDTTGAGYPNGTTVYWNTQNNISTAQMDTSTGSSYTITGLTPATHYYVWVAGNCPAEPSRPMRIEVTTASACAPVENLTMNGADGNSLGISWNAPSVGNAATSYIVSLRKCTNIPWNADVTVFTDTVTTTNYLFTGLDEATTYAAVVTTVCNNTVGEENMVYATTTICEMDTVGDYGTNYSAQPIYATQPYAYTQQIYLASELEGIDSISSIAIYQNGYAYNDRNITVYLGYTSKNEFATTTDAVPFSHLTQVYSGRLSGYGWLSLALDSTYVRNTDSNLVVAIDDNTGTAFGSNCYWACTNFGSIYRAIRYYGANDVMPSSPSGTSARDYYRAYIVFGNAACELSGCNEPIVMQTASTADRVDIAWNALDGTAYTVEYRIAGTNDWNTVSTANTSGIDSIMGLGASFLGEVRVSYECEGNTVSGTATISTLCGIAALPLAEDFEQSDFGNYQRACWISGSTYLGETNPLPRVTRLTGSEDRICHFQNGAYLILPEVAEDLDSLQIRFQLTQGNDDATLLLGLMTDASMPIQTMHVLDTLVRSNFDPVNHTVNVTYEFGHLDSIYRHARIAFWDAFGSYSFLNNIVVEYVPQCMPAADFSVDAVTTTSATISWDVDGLNATSYILEYGPRYFTPGTGTSVTGTASPITITGLTHSTSYDAYVYTVCANNNDTSIASQVIRFTTECDVVTTLPYTMDFENIVPPGTSPADALPNCWESVGGADMPHIIYTSTSSYYGSPDHCFAFNSLGTAALPQLSMPLNTLKLSFRNHNVSGISNGLIVGTVTGTGAGFASTFVPYDTVDFDNLNSTTTNVEVYFNDYVGTANRIAIRNYSKTGAATAEQYIDDIVVEPLPACIPPQHVRVEYALADEAYIVWSRGNSATYDVIYNEHGDSVTSYVPTSSREILLTGLTPETQYDVKIVDGCGDTVALTFTTACAITLPYVENFDSYTTSTTAATGVSVPCWNSIMTGAASYQTATYMPQVYYSSTYANSGNYSLRLYGIGYHMLPPMPTSLDSLQMVFFPHRTSTSYNLEVGVVEGNTFIPVDTVNIAINTHPEILVKFNNYHGNSRRIAFKNIYGTNGYSYFYIDDIEVDYIPTCPKVDSLHADAVLNNSADISWVSNGTESEWEVTCGGVSTIVYSTSTTITGLAPDSDYVVTVRPICSAGDTGRVRTIAIHTTCNPVSLPYTENFDSITTLTSTTEYGLLPNCWDFIMTGSSSYQGSTYWPRVYYSTTYAYSGNYCLYLYGIGYHTLPPMPTSLDSLEMTFVRRISSNTYGLEVGVMEGETFVPIEVIPNTNTSGHTEHTVYFATYTGNSRTIAFRNYYTTSTSTYYSYNYIDDIDIHYVPTCAHVMNIVVDSTSTNSITIDWTDVSPATAYQVEYGVAGFAQGTGTIHTCTTHPTTISGLTSATSYQFYVRPICTVGDTAEWYGPLTVATECVPITLPYTQNFDGVPGTTYSTAGQLPACWDAYTNGTTVGYTPHVVSSGSYWYADSAHALCMTSGSTATYGNTKVVALPPFTDPLSTVTIAFWMSTESQTNGCLHVGYLTGPNLTTDFVTVDSIPASAATYHGTSSGESALGIRDTVSFANIPATAQRLAFKWYFNSTFYSCCIDDVSVWADESCPAPVVTVSNVDYQSATITASGNNGNSYELNYGTDPSTYGTTLTSTTGTFNLTNLTPATQYFYRVMQYCDDNEVSVWTEGYFTTDSLPCFPVTGLDVASTSYESVTLTWNRGGNETAWEVMVYNTLDTFTYTASDTTYEATGLTSGVTYNANVRPLCGTNNDFQGEWSANPVNFTTDICQPVTNVAVGEVTSSTATISWTAPAEGSGSYRIEYGFTGFDRGQGQSATATGTTYTIEGLESQVTYDVYVANICTESLVSVWSDVTTFETTNGQGIVDVDAEGNLSIYPNPASAMVTVSVSEMLAGAEVAIVDLNGRTVMTFTLNGTSGTFDVSKLGQGAYFVRLTGEQATTVRKLIVK